ncbi:GGDEF domain-containing protein [Nodosilinea nodulosa]|uniref:GGDEF domain-containing protein n=1 Tax=Nodosilinea nodulosa TaxID=416001 RepID=UPI0002E42D9F|nr:GGDEF domain-containing protein [Nodosilinea nodulosa]
MIALMPHGTCFLWDPWLTSLHVVSDLAVLVAYFSIPLLLLLHREHIDAQIRPVMLLFAAFIFSCGIGHGLRAWNIWHANYWIEGGWTLVTASVSLYTAWQLQGLVPRLLNTHRDLVITRELIKQDPLTGIANRRGLEAALSSLTYQPSAMAHSLILIDLDGFKGINDTYGHSMGDQLLRRVGEVLRGQSRAIDLAARLGGDEFALLLVGCSLTEAMDKAEIIRRHIQQIKLPGLEQASDRSPISASIGVSNLTSGQELAQSYQKADEAL